MKIRTIVLLVFSHLALAGLGFVAGIYTLPLLIAPAAPTETEIQARSSQARYSGEFKKALRGSDAFHWGEGKVSIGSRHITFSGKLAPGPDYKLYLSPAFVETEAEFERLRASMVRVGDVKTFDNFVVEMAAEVDPARFNTVVVWCETFGEFISSAKYQ